MTLLMRKYFLFQHTDTIPIRLQAHAAEIVPIAWHVDLLIK